MPVSRSDEDWMDDIGEIYKMASRNGELSADSSLSSEQEDFVCSMCKEAYSSPRVLKCLHVFCEGCINRKLARNDEFFDEEMEGVTCPLCKQVTNMKAQDASSLPRDYVLMNLMDISAVNSSSVLCTSCKSKDVAIARCSDCPDFLCSSCTSAHQLMMCFESHRVLSLDELKESIEKMPLHRPIQCTLHSKKIEHYCITCQETICDDCCLNEHAAPVHVHEKLDVYSSVARPELENLMRRTKEKLSEYTEINVELTDALDELQTQHDIAKSLINQTYEDYAKILEERRDHALEDLEHIHKRQELKVMDTLEKMERQKDGIEHACNFTSRVLEYGNDDEFLTVKSTLMNQLELLSEKENGKPKYSTSVEFITNRDQFKHLMNKAFGYVKDPDAITPPEKPFVEKLVNGQGSPSDLHLLETASSNILSHNANPLAISMLNGNTSASSAVSISPVTSSPLSMPSSYDSDNFPTFAPQPPTPPLEGLTTLGEFNLTRLASLAACNGKSPSPPAVPAADGSSTFSLDMFGRPEVPSNLINNIQALAKLGGALGTEHANGLANGYGNMNIPASAYDANGDAGSVLGLVNGSSSLMMNGHGSNYDSGPSSYYASHGGIDNGMMTAMSSRGSSVNGGTGRNHNVGYHSYSRSNSQRAAPLEIHFKFGQMGSAPCQFNAPHGFCIDRHDSIIVVDTNNHRIQIFSKDGEFRHQFGEQGKHDSRLWHPRKAEILHCGNLVICDRGSERSRLQIFSPTGGFLKKVPLNLLPRYVDIVAGMTVAEDGKIVIVDSVQPALFKLNNEGKVDVWFDCKHAMIEPSDIAIRNSNYYICDFKGHSVAVFSAVGQFLHRIGNQGLTNYPNGIDVLSNGNILVGDSHGNKFHICIFSPEGTLLCEYECPYVKVSRCCGLKITSDGCIITVAKNNHHVLVLKSPL